MSIFTDKAPWICRKLMADFSLSAESAAAIVGNLGHESGGFKFLQEITPMIPGSRGGYGWAQWTGPRRKEFEAYCARNNFDPASDKANYGFLFVELSGSEKAAIPAVRAANGLTAKVRAFEAAFERAGVKHYDSRVNWATKALAAYHAAEPAPGQVTKPAAPAPNPDKGKVGGGVVAGGVGGAIIIGGAGKALDNGWSWGEVGLVIAVLVALAVAGWFAWRWWQARDKARPEAMPAWSAPEIPNADAFAPAPKDDSAEAIASSIAGAARERVAGTAAVERALVTQAIKKPATRQRRAKAKAAPVRKPKRPAAKKRRA